MPIDSHRMYAACRTGKLQVLKQAADEDYNFAAINNEALHTAIKYGHVKLVHWLFGTFEAGAPFPVNLQLSLRNAAEGGHLEVLKYLVQHANHFFDITETNNAIARVAAYNGHLEVLKWLVEQYGEKIDLTVMNCDALRVAAEAGHFDVVHWIINDSPQSEYFQQHAEMLNAISKHLDRGLRTIHEIVGRDHRTAHQTLMQQQPPEVIAAQQRITELESQLAAQKQILKTHQKKQRAAGKKLQHAFETALDRYVSSATCRTAAAAGVVQTCTQLDELMKKTEKASKHLRKL